MVRRPLQHFYVVNVYVQIYEFCIQYSCVEVPVCHTHQSHQAAVVVMMMKMITTTTWATTRNSLFGSVWRLRVGRLDNRGSILGRSGGFPSFPKRPDQLWADQPPIQWVHGASSPVGSVVKLATTSSSAQTTVYRHGVRKGDFTFLVPTTVIVVVVVVVVVTVTF